MTELETYILGCSSPNNPHFAMLNGRSFQNRGPTQISYLCVLVKNENLVYKEGFHLDSAKKIKPALKHQGKLHFSFEEATNVKGQICDGVLRQIQKQILVREGERGMKGSRDLLS